MHPTRSARRTSRFALAAAVTTVTLLTACSSSGSSAKSTTTPPGGTTSTTASKAPPASAKPIWLCRPGMAKNPCTSNQAVTTIGADGSKSIGNSTSDTAPKIDCFYVYPTVSHAGQANAPLTITSAERDAAIAQASRFSSVCNVYAPLYRSATLRSVLNTTGLDRSLGFHDVNAAFSDYLANDNKGRGFVLIGSEQGAQNLALLLAQQVDGKPLEKQLVSAILVGTPLTVPEGAVTGGSFKHIPICTSSGETGCVIAYSAFFKAPHLKSPIATATAGAGSTAKNRVICVNPAALGKKTPGALQPILPVGDPFFGKAGGVDALKGLNTPWVTYPDLLSAQCRSRADADWLQVTETRSAGDTRPKVGQGTTGSSNLHSFDLDLALGNLVNDVGQQAAGWK